MKTFSSIPSRSQAEVLVIGTFDGLHRGHRYLIEQALDQAHDLNVDCSVLTFHPDPQFVLTDRKPSERRLLAPKHKDRLMKEIGVDRLYKIPFDHEFASLSPEQFCQEFLLEPLQLRDLYVGKNFRFGRNRVGTPDDLHTLLDPHGIQTHTVETLQVGGQPVSSTRIRRALRQGKAEQAKQLLGRPYMIFESIQTGDGRGREMGFPTMNFPITKTLQPRQGVYAVEFGPKSLPAVANFGKRPTVTDDDEPVLEVHVLKQNFVSPADSRPYPVSFIEFLRGERAFSGADDLRRQISQDAEEARNILQKPAG